MARAWIHRRLRRRCVPRRSVVTALRLRLLRAYASYGYYGSPYASYAYRPYYGGPYTANVSYYSGYYAARVYSCSRGLERLRLGALLRLLSAA